MAANFAVPLCAAVAPSFQVICKAPRARFANHQLSPTITTPSRNYLWIFATVQHECIADARQCLDRVEVGTDDFAAEHRAFLEYGIAHARHF